MTEPLIAPRLCDATRGFDRVVVINDHSTATGGAAVLVLTLIKTLRARGVPVTFVTGDAGDAPDLAGLGVDMISYGGRDLLDRPGRAAFAKGLFDPDAAAFVARVRDRLDSPGTVYHVHNWSQILSPSIFGALRPVASRVILHAHDSFLACPNGMFMNYPRQQGCSLVPLGSACWMTQCDKRSYAHKLWRATRHALLYRSLDRRAPWAGIVTLHEEQAAKFARAGYRDALLRIIPNPATAYREERVHAEDNKMLAYIGRLEEDKGVMDLLATAARTGQSVRLIGDGSLRKRIQSDYPTADVTGWQPPDRIGALISEARAVVMPSRHPEPFGLVIAEAAQSGLPVLVSDQCALAPDVERLKCGFAFNVFAPSDFDMALTRIRDMTRDEIADMSRCGATFGGTLSTTTESWVDALTELYAGAAARPVKTGRL